MAQRSRTILLVDDSPEDRELYRRYLCRGSDVDYTILDASLGEEGLELWHQHRPDVVILDYRLPDLDGLDFLARLHSPTPQPCLPVIVVTGQGSEAIAVQSIKAGAQDYLVKEQITPEGLQWAVQHTIDTVQLRTQVQQGIERERVVSQITCKIHRSLNLDEVLQTTVTEVRTYLQTDRVVILRLQADGKGTVITESVGDGWTPLLSTSYHDPCFTQDYVESFRQGHVTSKTDIDIDDGSIAPCHVELLANMQVKANLVVPIQQQNHLWGLLIAHHCTAPRQWQPAEIDFLKELTAQVGIAVNQAELYRQAQDELAERTRIERELRKSEARFRTSVENMLDCFGIYQAVRDAQGEIVDFRVDYVNDAACRNNQMTRDQQIGQLICELLPGHHDSGLFEEYCQVVETGQPLVKENVFYADDYGQQRLTRAFDIRAVKLGDGFVATWRDISDRKRTEDALRTSERLLRLALTSAHAGSWDWEIPTNTIIWSPENFDLYGLEAMSAALKYDAWCNAIHPDDREWVNAEVLRVVEHRLPEYYAEFRIIHPQKGTRWLLGQGSLTYDDQGNPVRLSGINLDITERKQAEQALQHAYAKLNQQATRLQHTNEALQETLEQLQIAEEGLRTQNEELEEIRARVTAESHRYQDLFNFAPDGYVVTTSDGMIQEANQAFAALVNVGQHTLIGKPLTRYVHPVDRSAFSTIRWGLYRRDTVNTVHTDDLSVLSSDEVIIPVSMTGAAIYDLDKRSVVGIRWLIKDIRDRKQAELALSQATERLNLALKGAPITLFTQDRELRYTWIYNATLNFSPDDILGQRDEELFSPESATQLTSLKHHVLETGSGLREEVKVTYQGRTAYYDLTLDPVLDNLNVPIGITGAAVDISDRKQLELERERLWQQEKDARQKAEQANRVKDEFLAILSHELRSPLNPILGWSKLLQMRTFDAERTAAALATIERNALLQTQLIDDLLDVAKILRGRLSLQTTPVNLRWVIEGAIDTVQTAANAKNILLHPVLNPVGQVSGDSTRLQQIVWNLLSNAIKFTPEHGRVEIRLEQVDHHAQIIVSDTGKGIAPDFLPHIFESFRQEDASTTRNFGGLGIGLAIVRYLVESHGGTIWADSPGQGQGATFTVQLPLLATERTQPDTPAIPETSDALNLAGLRILAVDDEPDARDLITELLSQFGAEMLTVATADEALDQFEAFHPNVLVCDIGMADVDGYALIQQIRTLPPDKGGHIPAIALTAYAREEDRQDALRKGFQQHIPKPLDLETLVSTVIELTTQET